MPSSRPTHPYIRVGHRVIVRDDAFEAEDTTFQAIRGVKGTVTVKYEGDYRVRLDEPMGTLNEPYLYPSEIELLNLPENCENCQ